MLRCLPRHRLPVIFLQHRLRIEAVHLRESAIHEQKNHVLRLRLELRILNHPGARRRTLRRMRKGVRNQRSKAQHAEPSSHFAECFAPSNRSRSRNVDHESSSVRKPFGFTTQSRNSNSFALSNARVYSFHAVTGSPFTVFPGFSGVVLRKRNPISTSNFVGALPYSNRYTSAIRASSLPFGNTRSANLPACS